jgi:hypothetical protein
LNDPIYDDGAPYGDADDTSTDQTDPIYDDGATYGTRQ